MFAGFSMPPPRFQLLALRLWTQSDFRSHGTDSSTVPRFALGTDSSTVPRFATRLSRASFDRLAQIIRLSRAYAVPRVRVPRLLATVRRLQSLSDACTALTRPTLTRDCPTLTVPRLPSDCPTLTVRDCPTPTVPRLQWDRQFGQLHFATDGFTICRSKTPQEHTT